MSDVVATGAGCQRPGCAGHYDPDGYCDECGHRAPAAPPAPSAPSAGGGCRQPGCGGHYDADRYCDECGHRAPVGASAPAGDEGAAATAAAATGISGRTGATLGGPSGLTGTRSSRSSRVSGRGRLGAGLVDVPRVPLRDPASAVMADPVVPENRRHCGQCDEPVGRGRKGEPGRAEGFCPHCGARFSFVPRLSTGDLVDNRYEVLGCLAYGGLGWIYLARDRHVSEGGSDRWVVLKGLLNSGDPNAMEAAVAERRFLVEVDHPNIVQIYDFARHPDPATGELIGYIVMEYVGGRSLRDVAAQHRGPTGQREPLPLPQVLAYGLEILPALGYLHDRGLVFCDFKPDNVIQAEEQLKLIDLGAVRRADNVDGVIYGTPGYQAPDVATHGPSVTTDLYTVGRSLALLSFTFSGFSTKYAASLPAPSDVDLFVREPSYHRLLLRATHRDPERRFQSAADMAEQLLGVLREALSAVDGVPRPAMSTNFTGERRAFGTDLAQLLDPPAVAAALPLPLVDPADPAAGLLATMSGVGPTDAIATLSAAAAQPTASIEVSLRLVRAYLDTGDVAAARTGLDRIITIEPDWRIDWHRGLVALVAGAAPDALTSFTAVAEALPGEPAAQLAEAVAAELAGQPDLALARYERVWRVDRGFVSAAFGVARLLLARRERDGAVAVLDEVPDSSSLHGAAQVAAIRARLDPASPATERDLADAAARLERLDLDTARHWRLALDIYTAALAWLGVDLDAGTAAQRSATGRLLGHPFTERDLRLGLERGYRVLATLERDTLSRYALVDRANAVRPRTLV